jgi:hypothetical protein
MYWRRRVISAKTTGLREGEALQKICNTLPIRQDIASGNGDKEFYSETHTLNFK